MLALRPNCECCDRDLPPAIAAARICTFECTFCADCAEGRFGGICPNCGGGLVARPIRPAALLGKYPAQAERFTKAHAACGAAALGGGFAGDATPHPPDNPLTSQAAPGSRSRIS